MTSEVESQSLLTKKNDRKYVNALLRRERRYLTPFVPDSVDNSTDQTVDKYDFMIVFPLIKDNKTDAQLTISDRMTWGEARNIWYQCIPGGDLAKEKAIDLLRNKWKSRCSPIEPRDDDSIPASIFVSIARETVIEELSAHSGLQLKVHVVDGKALCRIRAPLKLLESQAASEGYKLQLKGEVDPGMEFWSHDVEITEEHTEMTKDEANETLERLYAINKISPNDLTVFDNESTSLHWSRRVHTLERIADKVPVTNQYAACVPFQPQAHLRHLYQLHRSVRGKTLFRGKDRIYLTKQIIDSHFILEVLHSRSLIEGIFSLHDANKGEALTLPVLQVRWVMFWKAEATKVGAPYVTHDCMQEGVALPFYLRPFSQPLDDIREYFGEQLALYFAWIGFYAYTLLIPSIIAIACEIYISESSGDGIYSVQVLMIAVSAVWAIVMKELWDWECKAISIKWGTDGFEQEEKSRPQFVGDPDKPLVRSYVTNAMETNFPSHKRLFRQFSSISVVLVFIVALIFAVQLMFYIEHSLVVERGFAWGSIVCSLLSAIQIQILSIYYKKIAIKLNDWENYRTQTEYDDSMIFKTFLFQMFNNYAALWYTAFVKGWIYECSHEECIDDVKQLMLVIFGVRFGMNFLEVGVPLLKSYLLSNSASAKRESERMKTVSSGIGPDSDMSDTEAGEESKLIQKEKSKQNEEEEFESEVYLEEYEGTFDNYSEIVLQFGYVVMFVSALPVVFLMALLECLIEIRVDSFKMIKLVKRPDVELAEDVGMWGSMMEALSYLGIISNIAMMCFSTDLLNGYSQNEKWIMFLVLEQIGLAVTVLVHFVIPDEPTWLRDVIDRNKFVINKYVYGHDEGGAASSTSIRGHLDMDSEDVDSLNLQAVLATVSSTSGKVKLTYQDKVRIKELEVQRREALQEIKIAKDKLQAASATEVLNDDTGIGETKFGLPLGCLTVKLIEVENLQVDRAEDYFIVISIKSTRAGQSQQAAGPQAEMSRSPSLGPVRGESPTLVFNQAFTMAPIRTQDAEIVFDLMEKGNNGQQSSVRRLGTSRVHLRELADQTEKEKVLQIEYRPTDGQVDNTASKRLMTSRLFLKLTFLYSKIVPLRSSIYQMQDELRNIERELMQMKVKGSSPSEQIA